ncbi:MAG TPA: CHASE2 domain-containing protein, partial [Candidatus Ozemobacteraceae bacterium]|nr:CHASE2 domain-containing protein [Candidatus Ozemobacteraceae bacterium]
MNTAAHAESGRTSRPWVLYATVLFAFVAMAPVPRHLLTVFENRVTDLLFVFVRPPAATHPVAIVAKDQLFVNQFGREPNRADMARALGEIARVGGRAAALDYIYDLPRNPEEDSLLAGAIASFPAVVTARHFVGRQGFSGAEAVQVSDATAERPPEPLPLCEAITGGATDQGLINQVPDADGAIRVMPLAFLPSESTSFIPTLGFAAWIHSELQMASMPIDIGSRMPDPSTASDAARVQLRDLWNVAPYPYPGFGHRGLDEIVRRREARMLCRYISGNISSGTHSSPSAGNRAAWADIADSLDLSGLPARTWLRFPGGRPPLTGSELVPCLRIPFSKSAGGLKGDGVPTLSMGVLLAEASLEMLGSIEIEDGIPGFEILRAAVGSASIAGSARDAAGSPLSGVDVLARQADGAAWASATSDAGGRFVLRQLPSGRYHVSLSHRKDGVSTILSPAEKILVGTEPIELPPARFPPADSQLVGTLAPASSPLTLVVVGEPVWVGITDEAGRLPLVSIPPDMSPVPVEGEQTLAWGSGSEAVVLLDGAPVTGRRIAVLDANPFWNARFTARLEIPAGAASYSMPNLPSALGARIMLARPSDHDEEPKSIDIDLLLDTAAVTASMPATTDTLHRDVTFSLSDTARRIQGEFWLLGDDGVWHHPVPGQTTLTLPAGKYLLLSRGPDGSTGRADRLATTLSGRTVFLGTTLREDQDFVTTPINFLDTEFRQLPGVNLHANLCSALARGEFLRPTPFHHDAHPHAWQLLTLLLLAPFLVVADMLFARGRAGSAVGVISAVMFCWIAASVRLFQADILFPSAFPVSLSFIFGIVRGAQAYLAARTRERETRATFGRFIAAPMVEEMLRHPDAVKPGGVKKELTVMFTDLAGFTSISELMTPEELTQLMNEYLGEMTRVLFEYGGTLDKYIGDAVVAMYGA